MFTGIVTAQGIIHSLKVHESGMYLTIAAPHFTTDLRLGDSVSVDGCCLTLIRKDNDSFSVEVGLSTLMATRLGDCVVGAYVNLEKALTLQQFMGGHWVTGHVDGVAVISAIEDEGFAKRITCSMPKEWLPFVCVKGSITLNGVSLTLQQVEADQISVMIIPHTAQHTNLGRLHVGSRVNVELDVLARYVARLLETQGLVAQNTAQASEALS